MRSCVSACLLLLAGCGRADEFAMAFDPCAPLSLVAEDEARTPVVEDAIRMWRAVYPVGLTATGTAAPVLPILFVDTALYLGRFDDRRGVIELANRVDERRAMAVVLAHELGHAMNLYHVGEGDRVSVMNKGNARVAPTPADGAALRARWGLCRP